MVSGLASLVELLQWFAEKLLLPSVIFGVGYRAARRNEAKAQAEKDASHQQGEDRRVQERNVALEEQFTRRWDNIEKYWTERMDEMRRELRECQRKEEECQAREDALQRKMAKWQRWAVNMVTMWNVQFPDNPMALPPENGNGGVK